MRTLFDKSVKGRTAVVPAMPAKHAEDMLPKNLLRSEPAHLPELSELDVIRHFTENSHKNFSVDGNFYPLGSCTMKYNAKVLEHIAGLPGFTQIHPLTAQLKHGEQYTQGALQAVYEAEQLLCEINGMKAFTMQPMSGANGEFTGVMLIAAYHKDKGNKKTKIIVPDSAHGTNPASAMMAGYEVVNIPSVDGMVDPDVLEKNLTDDVAALMMTCPNTLGLFERNLPKIVEKLRKIDALLYYDGANLNAIMGKMRVGDVGFDVVHLNLHKTMGTPHGGGGPGSGAVGVSERLVPYLPVGRVEKTAEGTYTLNFDYPKSIGYIAPFLGNFSVYVKALAYISRLGRQGIPRAAEYAVLNANYLRKKMETFLTVPFDRICMHEFVSTPPEGMKALDLAKALLEYGIHAPTIYFPLIVHECLMFEPTETENKETLDNLVTLMEEFVQKGKQDPNFLQQMPLTTPLRRLDETLAARNMVLKQEEE